MDPHLLRSISEALSARTDVVSAWVFGSVARGDEGPDSDVDVAVLRGRRPTGTLADIPDELVATLESVTNRRIDLVVVDHADPELVHHVLRDGILVADRDRATRIEFEVRKRNEYFDVMPFRSAYRRAALERARRTSP